MSVVYLNGEYLPAEEARISPMDRGFLLADGLYEVTPAYRGRLFRMPEHMARLSAGLSALRIELDTGSLGAVHERLLDENGLRDAEVATVYLQVTRGAPPVRSHAFPPEPVEPTVFAYARPFRRPSRERWERGFRAVTVPDRRWARVDIKSIALLPNVLAQQAAAEAGAEDALLVRDGVAMEGAHNNLFAVLNGELTTHPATHRILHGVTRALILELAAGLGHPVRERAIAVEELARADEVFFTGTTTEVRPTVEIDGDRIGDGTPGPVARALYDAFLEAVTP